ncbi:MAG: ACP S-malonyltransferase, partial [Pseudomonadota bacterium]
SLGEYAALVAAGSMAFTDAVRIVRRRGQLMQDAVPEGEGAMAAILGLEDTDLESLCEAHARGEVVSCANYNAPGQVVIAGTAAAVARVCEAAKEAGARRALPLPVSVPSHCALMRNAAQSLLDELEAVRLDAPAVPILHNADVATHATPEALREVLGRQLWQPVRWTRTIEALVKTGCDRFAECGPGKVLTGLNRRISRPSSVTALLTVAAMESLTQELSS